MNGHVRSEPRGKQAFALSLLSPVISYSEQLAVEKAREMLWSVGSDVN